MIQMSIQNGSAIKSYPEAVEAVAQRKDNMIQHLDRWFHVQLPKQLRERHPPHLSRKDLILVGEWKQRVRCLPVLCLSIQAKVHEA